MQFDGPFGWLDTETRAILQASNPEIAIQTDIEGYSLLLVKKGPDPNRLSDVISSIQELGISNQTQIKNVIAQQLTLDEAVWGQFQLSCCDCAAAFVTDEIVFDDNASYLARVTESILRCPEFELVPIRITFIPQSERGRQFAWQFLGLAVGISLPLKATIYRKKARLMRHWAEHCGVEVQFDG